MLKFKRFACGSEEVTQYNIYITRCRLFMQSWTALSQETADNLRSLQWHIAAYNE